MAVRAEKFVCSYIPYNIPNPFANKEVPNDFDAVRKILTEERSKNHGYDSSWTFGESEFKSKKQTLPVEYFNPQVPDECYIAVITYMGDFYSEFNSSFRDLTDEESWNNFPYKSFYYLLTLALPGILNDPDPTRDLFRGIRDYQFDPEPVIGDWFYYGSFASHTTDLSIVEKFLGNDGTVIGVERGVQVGCGISKYSLFEQEEEVLVFPRNKFKIKEFVKGGGQKADFLVLQCVGSF